MDEKVTMEQAEEALRQMAESPQESEPTPVAEPEPVTEPSGEESPEPEPEAAAPEPETDDVASLRKRLEEYEAKQSEKEKQFESRWKAFHDRATQNEQILRDRYLRKASTADRALKVLKATRTEQGVPEAEVDMAIRELESTMNPQSASYAPPPQQAAATEDQAIILNDFLNEKGMTGDEANNFGAWIRTEGSVKLSPMEQAVAAQSLDGFLRIAHNRWQQDVAEKVNPARQTDTVAAVKAVQRTQREAAKAASSAPVAPRKTVSSPGGKTLDIHKLPENERNDVLSELIRASVESR